MTPPIRVDPNAPGRINWLATSAATAPKVAPARVHMMRAGEELGGPNAIGRPGDLLLENDEVAFVIDRIGSSSGFAESGGNVVDAADARIRKDELGQQFTYFGKFPRQGVYETLSSGTAPDGSAWIEAKGRELYEPKLVVTTRYTLQAPDRALSLETTLENTGDAPIGALTLGDAIQWGGAEKIAPGKARGFKGPSSGPYVGGVGRFTSYAVTATDGAIEGVSGSTWTDTAQRDAAGRREVSLAPRQTATYGASSLVGERPDSASLVSELTLIAGQRVGALVVRLVPSEGGGSAAPARRRRRGLDVPVDARLSVQTAGAGEVLTVHAAGTPPRLEALLPPRALRGLVRGWRWPRRQRSGRRRGPRRRRGARGSRRLAAAGARVACIDGAGAAMPCKVTFERTDGAPPPDFGPAHAAGPARNQATTPDGIVDVPARVGRVPSDRLARPRVHARAVRRDARARAERRGAPVAAQGRRHRGLSGVRLSPAHDARRRRAGRDARPRRVERRRGRRGRRGERAQRRRRSRADRARPRTSSARSCRSRATSSLRTRAVTRGATPTRGRFRSTRPIRAGARRSCAIGRPREVFDELRRADARRLRHPGQPPALRAERATSTSSASTRRRGVGTDPGYDPRFDALEVWNGRNVDARAKVLGDFFALLRTGHPVTATADTDTHGIVGQEAGYPRTYVRVADDGPLDPWTAARTADVVRGVKVLRDVVLTNGPMLRVIGRRARPSEAWPAGRVVQS